MSTFRAEQVPRRWHQHAYVRVKAGLGPGEANVVLPTARRVDLVAAFGRHELSAAARRDDCLSGEAGTRFARLEMAASRGCAFSRAASCQR